MYSVHIICTRVGTIGVHKKAARSILVAQHLRNYELTHDMIEPLLAGEAVKLA